MLCLVTVWTPRLWVELFLATISSLFVLLITHEQHSLRLRMALPTEEPLCPFWIVKWVTCKCLLQVLGWVFTDWCDLVLVTLLDSTLLIGRPLLLTSIEQKSATGGILKLLALLNTTIFAHICILAASSWPQDAILVLVLTRIFTLLPVLLVAQTAYRGEKAISLRINTMLAAAAD